MKRIVIIILLVIAIAFAPQRTYTLTEGQGIMVFNVLETAKKVIPTSDNISAKEASGALIAIDSIQKVLYRQYADSTKKK